MLNALGFDVGKEDGIFGARTARAVMEYQRNVGARADGIVGLETVRSLEGMRPTVAGPSRAVVRETEAARSMGASLVGSVVAIDPGHGSSAPGVVAGDIVEAEVAALVAAELADELGRRGARPVLLRTSDEDVDASDRARRANAAEAALCVSIHLGRGELVPGGAVCCYYGTPSTHSPIGRRLAEEIGRELAAIGLEDAGVRPLAVAILRETRMPAVQVELAVPTNPDEASIVSDPKFASRSALAIADGVERFLEPEAAGSAP
jgi:N-acetylmuramoyl-L-alanine amidase